MDTKCAYLLEYALQLACSEAVCTAVLLYAIIYHLQLWRAWTLRFPGLGGEAAKWLVYFLHL